MPPDVEQNDGSPSSGEDRGDMIDHSDSNSEQQRGMTASSQSNAPESTLMNAKDPLRPRRKKARRACYACQRAHLTCGDERPCQRCIKRGIQDVCQDGVRKKAKYLYDAPESSLATGVHINSARSNQPRHASSLSGSNSSEATVAGHQQAFLASGIPASYGMGHQRPMPPPGHEVAHFDSRTSPTSMYSTAGQHPPLQMMGNVAHVSPVSQSGPHNPYLRAGMDPNDPSMFNFDLASLNFGNHYGALELGILGHLSSGVSETPPPDVSAAPQDFVNAHPGSTGFHQAGHYAFAQEGLMDWQAQHDAHRDSIGSNYARTADVAGRNHPYAFAIGAGGTPYTSPSSGSSPQQNILPGYESSPMSSTFYANSQQPTPQQQHSALPAKSTSQRASHSSKNFLNQGGPVKRPRHGFNVYETVKQPYPYTTAFHNLTAFLQRRFSPQKTLRIAKSLASIRPSFIACTKDLNRSDLIFMEKCFQRTLWEYEDFIDACGTPTIVCRRTGEVAAVGKEFSILTGWKKEVLLGKEPNLNVNTGGSSGFQSRASGLAQPLKAEERYGEDPQTSRAQPVFLAELLDDDSVIQFYEDFAKLAFGDSRGSVTTRCKLLKYRSRDEPSIPLDANGKLDLKVEAEEEANGIRPKMQRKHSIKGSGIQGESAIAVLGGKRSQVDCTYCWTVKRDVFDIPMLIVMNFLPCI